MNPPITQTLEHLTAHATNIHMAILYYKSKVSNVIIKQPELRNDAHNNIQNILFPYNTYRASETQCNYKYSIAMLNTSQ